MPAPESCPVHAFCTIDGATLYIRGHAEPRLDWIGLDEWRGWNR